jgi:hypothetical protein
VATAFVYWISKLIQLTATKENGVGSGLMNGFVCLSFFIIPISVTARSCSTFTASFFYLWSPFACLLGIAPFLYKVYGRNVTKSLYIVSFLAALYASYMEQAALFMLFFNSLVLLYLYKRDHKFHLLLFIEIAFIAANFMVSISAPGNMVRYFAEMKTWYPTFDSLSLFQKVRQGIGWTHLHLVRDAGLMMLLISLLLFVIVSAKRKNILLKTAAFIPSLYFIGSIFPANKFVLATTSHEYRYDVESILGKFFFNPMENILPLLVGGAVIFSLAILIFACIKNVNDRYLCVILFLAALASGYILGFSPTIFASGPRIFFFTDMLLMIIGGIVLKTMLEEVPVNKLLWKIACVCYCSLAGINALLYVGGIAMKTIFKLE